jgi:drug/metabolite transporter (DMT)-like permease
MASRLLLAAFSGPRFALPLLILGGVTISFSGIFVRLSEVGPSATGFYRMILALPLLWLWQALEQRHAETPPPVPASRGDWWMLVLPGLFLGADLVVWHWGLTMTSVANATVLGNSAPIFVTLAGWLFFHERFGARFLAGLALSIAGTMLLVGSSAGLGEINLLGDGLGVLAGLLYAAYLLSLKSVRARFTTARVMTASALSASALCLVAALVAGEDILIASFAGLAVVLGLAWLSHVTGQSLIAWAMAHLPASFSSITLLVNPLATTLLAWLILGEALEPLQAAGGAVLLFGILLARSDRSRFAPAAPKQTPAPKRPPADSGPAA